MRTPVCPCPLQPRRLGAGGPNANSAVPSAVQRAEFYSFIAKTMEKPRYHLQYSVDAPLQVRSVLYVPDLNMEKFGFGRMDPGVSLYARKVLIQAKNETLLPEWLRFLRGVVDSEDIPLNLSRELLQDSALIGRLGRIMTTRFIKFLQEQMRKDPEKYAQFFEEYSRFLREGIYSDHNNRVSWWDVEECACWG